MGTCKMDNKVILILIITLSVIVILDIVLFVSEIPLFIPHFIPHFVFVVVFKRGIIRRQSTLLNPEVRRKIVMKV